MQTVCPSAKTQKALAMLDASGGGRAVMVFVARHASGPAGVVQRWPGIYAVDDSPKAREEGRDGGAPYKSMFSVTREVYQVVLPGHPQYYKKMCYIESGSIILGRICLVWYWLILATSC